MRGAFGKPQGTVARVHIGQVIMSVRTKAQNKEHIIEALRRAKFKFPGRQKVKSAPMRNVSSMRTVEEGNALQLIKPTSSAVVRFRCARAADSDSLVVYVLGCEVPSALRDH